MAVRKRLVVLVAGVLAVGAVASGLVLVARASSGPLDDRVRSAVAAGIALRMPRGWQDKRVEARHPSVVFEVEHRPLGVPVAVQGLWVLRWTEEVSPDEAVDRWRRSSGSRSVDTVEVDGRRAVRRVEPIGPTVVERIPEAVRLNRVRYRFAAFEHVYEVGFWGLGATRDVDLENRLLETVRVTEPPPRSLAGGGVTLSVPGTWSSPTRPGTCAYACAWSPAGGSRRARVYLTPTPGHTVEEAADLIVRDLEEGGRAPVERSTIEIQGKPVVRLRFDVFDQADQRALSAHFEELVVEGDAGRIVVVALSWPTPEGRAEVDAMLSSLRL